MVARRALAEVTGRELDVRFVGDIVQCAGETRAEQPRPQGIVLNRPHAFASYMPASGNELGLQACRARGTEADLPAMSPVVLWGAPGVGKTHLLHATANCASDMGQAVVVLSAEEFANRYQQALRDKTVAGFQEFVRNAALFLVDDLQYLAGRTGTLTELVNSIDVISSRGGHVVVASEEHPNNLALPERLASRLRGGLIVAIGSIDGAERRAFVEHCATVLRASLPGWCIDRIAGAGCGSARTLR